MGPTSASAGADVGGGGWTLFGLAIAVATKVIEIGTVLGVVALFLPQYMKILKTRNAEGFSLYTCLALISAGILRIVFWVGHRYEIPLFLQAVCLVIIIMAIVHLITVVRSSTLGKEERRTLADFNFRHFWNWTDFTSFAVTIALFCAISGFLMYLLRENVIFVEAVGFVALLIEALLNMPQIIRNWRRKSTEGLSLLTFGQMFAGDVFKIVYFVVRQAPAQFWICGSLQASLSLFVWFQVWLYRSRPAPPSCEAEATLKTPESTTGDAISVNSADRCGSESSAVRSDDDDSASGIVEFTTSL